MAMNPPTTKAEHVIKKIARWSLWSALGLMAFMVGLHFLLPSLVNSRFVKNKIIVAAQAALPGQVDFAALRLNLFPLPSVVLTGAHLQIPDKLRVGADVITVYPKILPLMVGRVRIDAAIIQSPTAEIWLPAAQASAGAPVALPLPMKTDVIRSALSRLPRDIRIALKNGDLNIVRAGRSVARFDAVEAQTGNEAGFLRFGLQGRSSLAAGFQAEAELAKDSLDMKGQADFTGVKAAALQTAFWPAKGDLLPRANANLHVAVESTGLQTLRCAFSANAPAMEVIQGAAQVQLQGVYLEGNLRLSNQQLQATLSQVKIATPRLDLSAALNRTFKGSEQPGGLHLSLQARDSDGTAWRAALLSLAPTLAQWKLFDIIQGGTLSSLAFDTSGSSWPALGKLSNMKISGTAVDAHIAVPGVDLDLTEVSGDWQLTDGVLKVRQAAARLGQTRGDNGNLSIGLIGKPHAIDLSLDLDVDLAQLPTILKKVIPQPGVLAELNRINAVQGAAKGKLLLAGSLEQMKITVTARDIRLKAAYDRLPAPLEVQRGQFEYDGRSAVLKDIRGSMGDIHVEGLNGRVVFKEVLSVQCSVNGTIGGQNLQWAHARFDLPADFTLKAPIAVKGLDLAWQPDGRIALDGQFGLTDDLRVDLQLTMGPSHFDLSRLIVIDTDSNARVTARHDTGQNTWDASFDGRLESVTLAKIWQGDAQKTGWIKGRLALHFDATDPGRSSAQGKLQAGNLMIPLKSFGAAQIHHADLVADPKRLTINTLDLSWNRQHLALSGDLLSADRKVLMDLVLSAESLDLEAVAAALSAKKSSAAASKESMPPRFPVKGKIDVKVGQLVYGAHRWEPVRATVQVSEDQVAVVVKEANICGLATLGTLRWSSQGIGLELLPTANHQTLQLAGGCLTGGQSTERIEGTYSISGQIITSGQNRDALLRRMQGRINFDAADGRISNAGDVGLLTNILSYLSINKLIQGDIPDLKERDFRYQIIQLDLGVGDGRLHFNQANIRSETLNLVAEGDINMLTEQMELTVLVSPMTSVDTVVRNIPVVGKILKGTLIAIPVGVRGPLSNPKVLPLSPRAVGERLKGILERTLEAPYQLVEPLLESGRSREEKQREEMKP